MVKKLLGSFLITAFVSFPAHSQLISHSGYTLDTQTNIVTGGGLEWLQWDETAGLSVTVALSENVGWRMASASEMNGLLIDLDVTITVFDDPDTSDSANPHSYKWLGFDDRTEHEDFIELFGTTGYYDSDNTRAYTQAVIGNDDDDDGYHRTFTASADYEDLAQPQFGNTVDYSFIGFDNIGKDFAASDRGIALVRDLYSVPELSASAAPISALLLSALLCLGLERRRKKRKA
jgi:hypothetical protein